MLTFDRTELLFWLGHCDGRFAPLSALAAAERYSPFMARYYERFARSEVNQFRTLLDSAWAVAASAYKSTEKFTEQIQKAEEYASNTDISEQIDRGYALESSIIVVRASEAVLSRSKSKSLYAIEQAYILVDAIVIANDGRDRFDEQLILSSELMQNELSHIHRDCYELSQRSCSSQLGPLASQYKQRAVQEAEELQEFLLTRAWR